MSDLESVDKTNLENKREIKRLNNLEERHFMMCNVFFIFFFQFVCRREPLKNENIPLREEGDDTRNSYLSLKKNWQKSYLKYMKDIKVYEEIHSDITIKKPNLILITLKSLASFKLVMGLLFCIFGFV
jgi:hypothetical protein